MSELRQDMRELRQSMFYGFLALTVSQLGIIASVVAVH
jgi:hypothetical protein